MARELKRYKNRKLYDSVESRYVALAELVQWIQAGEIISVVEAGTGEDATAQTLAAIITEQARSAAHAPGTERLHELIRSGGRVLGVGASKLSSHVRETVKSAREHLGVALPWRGEVERLSERIAHLEARLQAHEDSHAAERSQSSPRTGLPAKRKAKAKRKARGKAKASSKKKSPANAKRAPHP